MDDDVQALAALQVPGALADHVRLRNVSTCPHCHRGFGSASLPIHIQRCRALYPKTEEEENAAKEKLGKTRKKEIRPLVDLCLQFVTKHFESICMEKVVAFPEAEAALIASMPSNLVHRMVITLVKESKRVNKKNRESRAHIETLARELQSARRDMALLESSRDAEASMRARLGEQQHITQRLERELDTIKTELATAEAENRQLRSKIERTEKSQLRLEAKINSLNAEKETLKKAARETQRREMEATRQLVSTRKASRTVAFKSPRTGGASVAGRTPKNSEAKRNQSHRESQSIMNSARRRTEDKIIEAPAGSKSSVLVHKRPRSDGSKIPFPPSMTRQQKKSLPISVPTSSA